MKILCFGSLNLDKVYRVPYFVRSGETLASSTLNEFCGGKGLNQSIALARAGAKVYHAGCVGASDGGVLLETLRNAGADVSMIRQLACPTGHAIIQVDATGQNCILLYGGANQQVSCEQIDSTLSHFQEGDILVLQNEISNLRYLIEQAAQRKMVIVLNPSPMTDAIRALPLHLVSYFMLNEVEARDLCGESAADEDYLDRLLALYPSSRIVLTLGSRGCIYRDADQQIRFPACRVQAVDTTAAGDTFTGFFVAGIAAGASIRDSLSLSTRAAAISVSRAGASTSIPTREEVLQFPEPVSGAAEP